MAKIEITKTELVWPGKYNEDGTRKEVEQVNLPFQVIETINETRATREAAKKPKQKSLFDIWQAKEGDTFEEGWKNKLIWGDNLLVMSSLLEKFAGKIDLIYIDPPFATGADFSFMTQIGESDLEIPKEQSIIEEKAYRDTWGKGLDSYLKMIYERLILMKELLTENGSIYIHLDINLGHWIRGLLDEVFSPDNFHNQIVRIKCNPKNFTSREFGNIHDLVFFYTKTNSYKLNRCFLPRDQNQIERDFPEIEEGSRRRYKTAPLHGPGESAGVTGKEWHGILPPKGHHWRYVPEELERLDAEGRIHWSSTNNPRKKVYADESPGYAIQDIWMDFKDASASEYPTQKNEGLLDLIIRASSDSGDLVADFFCGSGTTLAVAEKLGRRWIGCDLSRWAIHVTRKRLLGIENCKPFEILNLGKYERKYWQGVTFGDKKKTDQQLAIYQYLAFILKLYGAEPISGMNHLHGKKGKAMVHIGAVDAPVTIDEINACLDECVAIQQKELHVLGWEWEMGLYDLMIDIAKGRGVKLVLLNIPREVMEQQAVNKGDIQFFELAYLEVDIIQEKGRKVIITLKDFVIPNTELIPEEIRSKIKKWSDYIDYWAVDWNFQNDTFMNGWVTYRTRKDRTLSLKSDPHTYEKAGKYTIMVKIVDIFGNDTSQAFEVEVR
jgi:adenine specific DNA methylase Mod